VNRKRSKLKNINIIAFVIFSLFAIFYLINERYSLTKPYNGKIFVPVILLHDGDTVSVIINNRKERVRLIGIDAPEMGQKSWGKKAKKYLETILDSSGWEVTLEFDVDKRDKYGRILAYLWTKNREMVNLLMVKNGYAMLFTFPPNIKYVQDFRVAQKEAREKGLGIWGDKGLKETPSEYRRKHPRI
jgi:micrococcal nuclease